MAANSSINVTSLDFDAIKASMKAYISSKPEFTDYNFEGSTISILFDLLAYNTYQNAFYTSMVGNEMFLDSALLRESVVSRAKMLGYTPRSARGASTSVTITVTPGDSPDSVNIAKNTEWSSTVDGVTYKFVTPQAYSFSSDENYSGTITLTEGRPVTHRFTVSSNNPIRYVIPNDNVDTTSIGVTVQESSGDPTSTTYTLASDITEVDSTSLVYFLQEVENQRYEVYFGDGVLGKSLVNGNIVIISYRICNGTLGNDISTFSDPSEVGGYDNFTISVSAATSGGANNESIDSIKFNAPKNYETQNRAVLADDYERLILSNFPEIQTLSVWGGEDNAVPVYGKVFVSLKPISSLVASQTKKDEIRNYLKKYNVLSIDIEFVDPTYLFVVPNITIKWDSRKTTLTAGQVRLKAINAIQAFELSSLGRFDKDIFRFSLFSKNIDAADQSILSNETSLKLEKRFTPNYSTSTKYTIHFGNPLENITRGFQSLLGIPINHPGGGVTLSSSAFTYSGRTCYLDDDGFGNVRLFYYLSGNTKAFLNRRQGTINYTSGVVTLNSFAPTSAVNNIIKLYAIPQNLDINSSLNQLILFGVYTITMQDEGINITTPATTVTTTGAAIVINQASVGTII